MLQHLTYPPSYDSSHLSFQFYTLISLEVFGKILYSQRGSGVWCQCIRHQPAIAAWFQIIVVYCFHIFSSSYFTTSSAKVTSAEDCSLAKQGLLPTVSREGHF